MTTRPSEPSSRRHPADFPRRDKPALLADRELRPPRAAEPRRAAVPSGYLLGLGDTLPSDYYLG